MLEAVIGDVAGAFQPYLDDHGLSFPSKIIWQRQYGHRRWYTGEEDYDGVLLSGCGRISTDS